MVSEKALPRFPEARLEVAERRPYGLAMRASRFGHEFGWAKTHEAEYLARRARRSAAR